MNVKQFRKMMGKIVVFRPQPKLGTDQLKESHNSWTIVNEVENRVFLFKNKITNHELRLGVDNIDKFQTPNILILRGQATLKDGGKMDFEPSVPGISSVGSTVLNDQHKVPSYKLAVALLAAVVLGIFALVFINYRGNPSTDVLYEIRDLLRQKGYPDNPNKLLQKYPLGYAIFELNYMNQFTPYEGLSVLKNYEKVDWSQAKVIQNTKDRIALQLPDLKRKDGTVGITGVMTGGWKKVGYLGCGGIGTGTESLYVCGEILAIREDRIVFLVNLMQMPLEPK
jgi:hypothetical protein